MDPKAFAPPADLKPPEMPDVSDFSRLRSRALRLPVEGFDVRGLRDNFAERRGARVHEAIDLLAPRGTPVVAVDDGVVKKLFTSVPGGLTVYQYDPSETYAYYYAHLDRYAEGLAEGKVLKKGDRVGYVGTTGNAPPGTPHLHFTIYKLPPTRSGGREPRSIPTRSGRSGSRLSLQHSEPLEQENDRHEPRSVPHRARQEQRVVTKSTRSGTSDPPRHGQDFYSVPSSRNASSSATTSRSFGRPAAA